MVMRRRGEPQPPRRMADELLVEAPVHKLEEQIAAHEEWAGRLEARDPGAGLPPSEADRARGEQLAELEKHISEAERLRVAVDVATDPKRVSEATAFDRFRRGALQKAISETQSDADRDFLHDLHEKGMERDRSREARRRIAEIGEKRRHPPDARARSVVAALFSDSWLADADELRLRDDILLTEDGRERHIPPGEFVKVRIVETRGRRGSLRRRAHD
jgi:hypothetical protein